MNFSLVKLFGKAINESAADNKELGHCWAPDGAELHSVTLNEKPTTSQNIKFFPFVKPESTHLSSLKFKCSIRELHTILFLANSIKL